MALSLAGGAVGAQAPAGPRPAGQIPQSTGTGEVSGKIVDSDGSSPVVRAAVAVRSKRDSSLVTGAMAGDDGSFRIHGLKAGAYYLRITKMGHTPLSKDLVITDAAPRVAAGNIPLGRAAVALSGVSVTAERATMTIEPDRNTYRAKDVAPTAANASDVLDNVPSVQVDGDGKVSLRGNENVAVQINGRPSPIRGEQLGAYLKQIPSSIIERIEVVPNPSAKQDPEGMAGIINIVLKGEADLGMSGGLTLSGANTDRFNTSGNIGYQMGALTTFTTYGFNSDERSLTGINNRENLSSSGSTIFFSDQTINGTTGGAGHNFTQSADYKFNKRDVLTNSLVVNRRRNDEASLNGFSEFNGSRVLLDQYNRLRDSHSTSLLFDYTLAFKRTLEPRKHEIGTELRLTRTKDDDNTMLFRQPLSSASQLERELSGTDALTKQAVAQLDYTRTLAPRTKLETGYKGTGRWLDRDYLVRKDALGTGTWVTSPLSNNFGFDEQVQAAYSVLSHGVGKFELQGGLRAEYASRDFTLASSNYPYNYGSLFPSGVASYKFSDATNAKLSYSRRIRRPGTQELNPFPQFFDVQTVFIGNPELSPEYTDAYEFGLTRTGQLGTLQMSPYYRRTTDIIRVDIDTDGVIDGRDVTTVSFRNLATSTSWGSDFNGQLRLGKRFNGFAAFNIYKQVTDGGSTSALGSNGVTWTSRLNGTAQLTEALTLQGSWFYRAPMKIEKGKFSAFQMTNFSLRQKIYGEKATLSLRVVDPFNTTGFRIETGNNTTLLTSNRKFGVRGTFLTFQYNFGQAPKIRPPRQDTGEQQAGFPQG